MSLDKTQKIKSPIRTKTIPKICSWCNKIYELKYWEIDDNRKSGVSHGMCPECHEKHKKMFEEQRKKDEEEKK
jgi:formate dehydrogenase maturation protein FdhE